MGCSVNGGGVSLGSEFGSIGYLNYCDGMRGRSVIRVERGKRGGDPSVALQARRVSQGSTGPPKSPCLDFISARRKQEHQPGGGSLARAAQHLDAAHRARHHAHHSGRVSLGEGGKGGDEEDGRDRFVYVHLSVQKVFTNLGAGFILANSNG